MLSVIFLASVAVAATGCNHDTLGSGTQALNMTYRPSPSGAGRWDRASFTINRIQALPTDPEAAAIFGTERLLFRFSTFTSDLTQTQDVPFANIALSTGTYRITLIEFTPPTLVDTNVSPTPVTCLDGVDVLSSQSAPGIPSSFVFSNPAGMTFTVLPGQTTLSLTVNVPGLIAGYESSFTCQDVCAPPKKSPCVTAFNQATFEAALLANVTFE